MSRSDGIWQEVGKYSDRKKIEQDITALLNQMELFEDLSNRDLRQIAQIAYRRFYAAGEAIVIEGQDAAGMYIIMDGEVEVTKELEDGSVVRLAALDSGNFFGDVGLIDNSPRTATVQAVRDSEMIGFFRPELLKLMDSHARLASSLIFTLAKIVASRLRFTNRKLQEAQSEIDQLQTTLDALQVSETDQAKLATEIV